MTLDEDQTKALRAFWHKNRRVFVPCTIADLAVRVSVNIARAGELASVLVRKELATAKSIDGNSVYDLTPEGQTLVIDAQSREVMHKPAPMTMAELARAEKKVPKLPPPMNYERLAVAERRESAVLAAMGPEPVTTGDLSRATGIPVHNIRGAMITLEAAGLVVQLSGERGILLFGLPEAKAPAPQVEKYPGTMIDARLNAEPSRICNIAHHINAVRLAAEPPAQRLDAILQGIAAQGTLAASTGKNGGAAP